MPFVIDLLVTGKEKILKNSFNYIVFTRLRITSHGCLSGNIRIHSKRGTIKLSYQLLESDRIPSIGNFLPYSLWPPMVKHYLKATGKTRLQLMQEEEQVF